MISDLDRDKARKAVQMLTNAAKQDPIKLKIVEEGGLVGLNAMMDEDNAESKQAAASCISRLATNAANTIQMASMGVVPRHAACRAQAPRRTSRHRCRPRLAPCA